MKNRNVTKIVASAAAVGILSLGANRATAEPGKEPISERAFVQAVLFGEGPAAGELDTRDMTPSMGAESKKIDAVVESVVNDQRFRPVWEKVTSGNPYSAESALRQMKPIAISAAKKNSGLSSKDFDVTVGKASTLPTKGDGDCPFHSCVFQIAVVQSLSVATTLAGATQAVVVGHVVLTKNKVWNSITDTQGNDFYSKKVAANITEKMAA